MPVSTYTKHARLALLTSLLMVAACSSGEDPATTASPEGCAVSDDAPKTLSAGGLISGSYGAVYVAEGLGYYEEAGFEVEFVNIADPADALGLLSQGGLDIYLGAPGAGMLNQINAGLDVRIAAAGGTIGTDEEHPAPSGFYVNKDLYESGVITEAADIEGRKIGSFGTTGSAVSYYIGLLAESANLTLNDVDLVELDPPGAVEALDQGGIEISYLTAPFSTQSVERGIAVPLVDAKEIYGDEQAPVLMFGPALLEEDPAAGCAFLAATMRGAEDLQGEYWNNSEVAEAFAGQMGVDPGFIEESAVFDFDPELANDPATVENMQRMFGELELLQYEEPLTGDDVFAEEIRLRAVEERNGDA